jgi:predicted Zn-dependent peptidase
MNLMKALYRNHPIRVAGAGSQESISHITPEILYTCHKAFYHPSNMVLCVAGNLDAQRVTQIARELLPAYGQGEILRDYGEKEPETVAQAMITRRMEVSTPIFQLGCKADVPERGEAALRQKLLANLAAEALLGTSSPLYAALYAKGLVNNSFSYGYEDYPGCAFMAAGGESPDPEAVRDAVMAEVARVGSEGLAADLWERLKKAAYGSQVRSLNSFEHLCVEQAQSHFAGLDYLRFPEVFETIGQSDAENCIRRWFAADQIGRAHV